MRTFPPDQERLALLNEAQPDRPWNSCEEKRRCVACERVFRGASVKVRMDRQGMARLSCPACGSEPALWVRLGNPLTDHRVWAEWDSALDLIQHAMSDDSGGDLAAVR